MISSKNSIRDGQTVTLYAVAMSGMGVREWIAEVRRVCDAMAKLGIEISDEGTNAAAECWPMTFSLSPEARQLLEKSTVVFSDEYLGI